MFELVPSKAFVLLALLAMFNLVAVPVLMFNLRLFEENLSIATQASVTAVEKLFNLDTPVLGVTEDEKHTDNYSCITFGSAVTARNVLSV